MSAKSDEFKVQLLETFASLITAAFGLVAALAWNDTIKAVITKNDRVVLEFTSKKDRAIGKRTIKKSRLNPNGGLIERSVSVHVSNVTPVAAEKTE